MSVGHLLPPISGGYIPTPRPKKRVSNRGYDLGRVKKYRTLLTDHQVLEARWLVEFGGWTHDRVVHHYGLSAEYVHRLMNYATRSKLFPKESDFPKGYQPSQIVKGGV